MNRSIRESSTHLPSDANTMNWRVLIDGSKLLDEKMDGIRRYVHQLLCALQETRGKEGETWQFDVALQPDDISPLADVVASLRRGELPVSTVPRLLRRDSSNPFMRCHNKLSEIEHHWGLAYLTELGRSHAWKAARSTQKRYRRMKSLLLRTRQPQYDLLHLTAPNAWEQYKKTTCPLLVTVHDLCHLVCPEFQTPQNCASLEDGLRYSETRGAEYIAVSHSTKEQMTTELGIDVNRIRVVHEASDRRVFHPVSSQEQRQQTRHKYAIPNGPFLLSLGTLEPRKNLLNVVQAFQRVKKSVQDPRLQLVIAGAYGWGDNESLQAAIANCNGIRQIGYVAEEDMAALYSAAHAFVYVSHYEGFGLPLLEAMACGTPVVFGDNSSMPEIGGDAGLPANANDVHDIERAFRTIVTDESTRQSLADKALARSREFQWQTAAERTLNCYRELLKSQSSRGERQNAAA